MRRHIGAALAFLIALATASTARAQRNSTDNDADWMATCRSGGWDGDDDRGRACDVRQVPMRLDSRSLQIDGRQNGSIRVRAWDGDSVRVTARLQTDARSDDDARRLLADVRLIRSRFRDASLGGSRCP